jgi:hypothetical protein
MFTETSRNGIVKFSKIMPFLTTEDAGNQVTDFAESTRFVSRSSSVTAFFSEKSFKDRFMNGVSTENAVNNTTHNWRDCFFPKKHTG